METLKIQASKLFVYSAVDIRDEFEEVGGQKLKSKIIEFRVEQKLVGGHLCFVLRLWHLVVPVYL